MSHALQLARLARDGAPVLDTLADLRAIGTYYGGYPRHVFTAGGAASRDGGGGEWEWIADSSEADNAAFVVLPNGHLGDGRYHRIWDYPAHPEWAAGELADHEAIQLCLDITKTCELRASHYISGTIRLRTGCRLTGVSEDLAYLMPTGNFPAVAIPESGEAVERCVIRGLTIVGTANDDHYDQHGIALVSSDSPCNQPSIIDVKITGMGGIGIHLFGGGGAVGEPHVQGLYMRNVRAVQCKGEGLRLEGLVFESLVERCWFGGNGCYTGADTARTYVQNGEGVYTGPVNVRITKRPGATQFGRRVTFTATIFNNYDPGAPSLAGLWINGARDMSWRGCDFEGDTRHVWAESNDYGRCGNLVFEGNTFALQLVTLDDLVYFGAYVYAPRVANNTFQLTSGSVTNLLKIGAATCIEPKIGPNLIAVYEGTLTGAAYVYPLRSQSLAASDVIIRTGPNVGVTSVSGTNPVISSIVRRDFTGTTAASFADGDEVLVTHRHARTYTYQHNVGNIYNPAGTSIVKTTAGSWIKFRWSMIPDGSYRWIPIASGP